MNTYEDQELLNLTRQNNYLLRRLLDKLDNQNSFDMDVLANLFAGLFHR